VLLLDKEHKTEQKIFSLPVVFPAFLPCLLFIIEGRVRYWLRYGYSELITGFGLGLRVGGVWKPYSTEKNN
jgi:hypothetical protein